MMSQHIVKLFTEDLYSHAEELFVESATLSKNDKESFTVALSGGNTPKPLYKSLADRYGDPDFWRNTHVFFGDERCVPPDDEKSNYRMAQETLLSRVSIPQANIHRMRGEIDPQAAASQYELEIRKVFALTADQIPVFDLVLLGMGADGHTASLFPGTEAVNNASDIVAAVFVPKMGSWRLTITPLVIWKARRIVVMVSGGDKTATIKQVMEGPYKPDVFPAQLLRQAEGEVAWLISDS